MTQPKPIVADYGSAQMGGGQDAEPDVLLEFETANGLLILQLNQAGAAELEQALSDLPLSRHLRSHRQS
ncbi:MAG TPA: hypothetical protein VMB81_30595 [Candidatus Sulfotelmatobacter sp.]|nr:hypothetical protein [Candidatus Sulfotelmatobacter sp.]